MIEVGQKLAKSRDIATKVSRVFQRRMEVAREHFSEKMQKASQEYRGGMSQQPMTPWQIWTDWQRYATDFAQRSILFWDTIRQRGNNFVEHERAGKPPLLHFDYKMVVDGRKLKRPVNYAMVRITPPEGVAVDDRRRPYVIIDPRAGHGPGIGGFKEDSEVGVALRAGHPVYFVIFFPEPEPGQTLLDVCDAEALFIHKVRELHPDSPKPAIVGNCQGGWAAMMLVASNPDETGPIVINGAPMSYWGGAWSEGEGDNPMRYIGGIFGGSWLASLGADLGDGIFDGAWLVENFEQLNPANSYWDKYYHLFANADTEPPRFLEFERWWSGFYLLNREEMEWIVQNLFVGNKIWKGEARPKGGGSFDLREIKVPIILFASMGDNITPPQQAFNWVADVYGSTEEIKARGQTIVGLLHQDIGHLGIFVSGKVAKKEHAQVVSVMKSIESLPPGLYGMQILESRRADGTVAYDVQFIEHRLEEITQRLNRLKRADEKPFEAVAVLSEFNQRAYELFGRPFVQAFANKANARMQRMFNSLRLQRWAISDLNPWLGWLAPTAKAVKERRQQAPPTHPIRQAERLASSCVSASLDLYRDVRDALTEATFFTIYSNIFVLYLADQQQAAEPETARATPPREMPFVREALAAIAEGGYPEALARVGAMLADHGRPIPLARIELKEDLLKEYRRLLPDLSRNQMRRIRGEQEIIIRYESERAFETLPQLLADPEDRERFLELLDRLLADRRILPHVTPEQHRTVKRIEAILSERRGRKPRQSLEVIA